ncbi:MAG TPA: hypothetical protein VGM82_06370 [Gemmatimonadaceae bacterium]|jgi:hypothetical protein
MTTAVATPSSEAPRSTQTVPIVILGTDALLAALPATPVQLAHACLRAGFANAIPASWGDELIAAAVLRRLPQFDGGPAILCSCPIVAHRLLSVGGDLRPAMMGFVAPPVAIARYVRALSGSTRVRITYVGGCPGANDEAIDIRMRPDALLALLGERGIVVDDQPRVFESILPPDRRRFRSQPGGVPTAESLWSDVGARTLVEMDTDDFVTELAQQLLSGKNVLIDAGPHLGCVCSGAVAGVAVKDARPGVVTLEPPRAMMPIVEEHAPIDLDLAVPAATRAPLDISAAVAHMPIARHTQVFAGVSPSGSTNAPASPPPLAGHRFSPVRTMAAIVEPKTPHRPSGPIMQRAVLGTSPVSRDGEGKSLPRAYVARRRPSPRAVQAVAAKSHSQLTQAQRSVQPSARATVESQPSNDVVLGSASTHASAATLVDESSVSASVTIERPRYEPPHPAPAVVPERITLFDVPVAAARESRGAFVPAADAQSEKARMASRPRAAVAIEGGAGMSWPNRHTLFVAIGIGVVLCALTSAISAIVVTRVVRSSASPAVVSPPTTAKP